MSGGFILGEHYFLASVVLFSYIYTNAQTYDTHQFVLFHMF